jgi:hypothetical protein
MQVSTEHRFVLTVILPYASNYTMMFSDHDLLMWWVNAFLRNNIQLVSVETLESAIRAAALQRGVW